MNVKYEYPDYAAIEAHIRRARIERSVAVSQMIVQAIMAVRRGIKAVLSRLGATPRPSKTRVCAQ